MAQYIIESGHGDSGLSKKYNNYFGMKVINRNNNPTTQIPNAKGFGDYGVYPNWKYSVIDRLYWDDRWFEVIPTREVYVKRLGEIYAEAENYERDVLAEAKKWR